MTATTSFFAGHRTGMSHLFGVAAAPALAVSGSAWRHTVVDACRLS